MEWLSHNSGVVQFAVLVAGIVGVWAVNGYRLKALEESGKASDLRAKQSDEKTNEYIRQLERLFNAHASNTELHIDPRRDKAIWEDFQGQVSGRFDNLDRKFDKVMLLLRPE